MSTEREEYIRRLVDKAERERVTQERPTGNRPPVGSTRAVGTSPRRVDSRPSARHASQHDSVRREASSDMSRGANYPNGKNGRQMVEDHMQGGKPVTRRAPQRTATSSQTTVSGATRARTGTKATGRVVPAKQNARKATPSVQDGDYQSEAHIWCSLGLIFVSLYLAVSTVSYIVYWGVDEHLAYIEYLFDLRATGAENWGGKLGAIVGNLLVGRGFGVMGVGFAVLAMIGAVKVLKINNLPMYKGLRSVFLLMFTGSVALGHFAGYDPEVFGSGYGGQIGIYIASWLESVIGSQGSSLLIVIGTISILYFVNSTSLRSLVRWISHRIEHSKVQRAARMVREREQDVLLREQLIERQASTAARSAAMTSMLASVLDSKADEQPQEQTNDTEDSTAEISPNITTLTTSNEVQGAGETSEVNLGNSVPCELDQITKPAYDPSALLHLEGDQWGYIYDWDVSGTPIYLYADREMIGSMPALSASVVPAVAVSSAFGGDGKSEPIEEHEIEFVVKTYAEVSDTEATFDAITEQDKHIISSGELDADQLLVSNNLQAVQESVVLPIASAQPITKNDDEPRKAVFMPSPDDPNFIVERHEGDLELDDTTINLTELYDPTLELSSYKKPLVDLMTDHSQRVKVSEEELLDNKNRIVNTLETFGIKIATIEATIGPTVTLYEIIPAPGIRISKIKNLEDDIALSLSALGIRIIAPIPGRGTIGIEVPNKDKETVSMYSVIKSAKFQESKFELPIALGKTIQNETFVVDLAKMPHLLVAGATGQGKSVGLNAIITSLLYKKHPSQLKFILVDPKKVELTLYAKLEKHFLAKMPGEEDAIITDTQKVIYTLNSICVEMDARYDLLKAAKVRNISEYNDKFIHRRLNPEKGHRFLPYFVVIIDEFADLIMTAGREVEIPIARIAQLARAVGIHLIIATQRPTTNIITGVIKANFPARIAFRVTSMIDSRTILDSPGANQLVGRGDMLVSTGSEVTRVQCAFIDTPEVDAITEYISAQRGYVSAYELPEYVPESKDGTGTSREVDPSKRDPLFEEVARYVVSNQNGSASTIQRKFSIGFNRAGRLVDQLEAAGIVGSADGSKARQVLVQDPMTLEMIIDG